MAFVKELPRRPEAKGDEAPSDGELLRRTREERDGPAFEELVRRHQRSIYLLARRFTRDHDEAADLAQRAFVRAYTALPRFEGRSAFRTWLFRIALNLCRNWARDRARRAEVSLAAVPEPRAPEAAPGGPAEAAPSWPAAVGPAGIVDRREVERVRQAVAGLPDRQRLTLELRVYHGLTFAEVAEVLGCRAGTARVNYHHAVARLRKLLAGDKE